MYTCLYVFQGYLIVILDKLGWYGIQTDWFADWLQNRTQTIRGGSSQALGSSQPLASRPLEVTHGVVQGSILGPVLFLLFTNDLTQHIPHGKVVMYADDAQFLDTDTKSNITALKSRVESSLDIALKWFTQNRLKINPSKTEMIILKSKRQNSDTDFSIQFGGDLVSPSSSVRVLGVVIDSCLLWEKHVSQIVKRCYAVLVGLARMRNRLPQDTKRMLVEALVLPHVRYCISVWGSCTAEQKNRVQKAINFGARITTGLNRREHVTPALLELGWGRVDDVLDKHDVSLVRRLLTDTNAPEILSAKLQYRSELSAHCTRAADRGQMQLPRVRTEFARRSFISRATRAWNNTLV